MPGVLLWVVDITVVDTGIIIGVSTWNTDEFAVVRFSGLTTRDAELGTGRIEFSHAPLGGEEQSDDFMAYPGGEWLPYRHLRHLLQHEVDDDKKSKGDKRHKDPVVSIARSRPSC